MARRQRIDDDEGAAVEAVDVPAEHIDDQIDGHHEPTELPAEAYEEPGESVAAVGLTTTDGPRSDAPMEVVYLNVEDIEPHPLNPNEETPEKFNALTETLSEDGPDQPIVVVPIDNPSENGPHYRIIKGEHRWRAARVLGWPTFPAVIRHEWKDEITQLTRLVRDNTVKGDPNKEKMTEIVRVLRREHQIDSDMSAALLGFDSTKEMYAHMVRESKPKAVDDKAVLAQAKDSMKVLDDLALVLNMLFTKHGSTLPQGYIAFMWGGKVSYMIELTEELRDPLDDLAKISADRKVDLNLLLGMILKDAIPTYKTAWSKAAEDAPPADPAPA